MRIVQYEPKWSDGAVRKLVKDSYGHLEDLILLSKADITSSKPERVQRGIDNIEQLKERIEKLKDEETLVPALPKGIGHSIMKAFNLESGTEVGYIKKELEEMVISGELESNKPHEYYIKAIEENNASS